MPEQLASGLSSHPRVRQEHPVRVRGQEQVERPLQARLPLRRVPAEGGQEHPVGQLPRQEKVIRGRIPGEASIRLKSSRANFVPNGANFYMIYLATFSIIRGLGLQRRSARNL